MKTLVLCIDRDDDLGRKAKVKGPVVGIKNNLSATNKLALVDPQDSDVNAIFAAVKVAKELNTEIATLTGDINTGVTSDRKIVEQLERLIDDLKPEDVIVVTDGAEDEQIIPIIESRIKITSIQTVIVKQSAELEKAYFTATSFFKEVSEDPEMARLFLGIPGIAIMVLAVGVIFNALFLSVGIMLSVVGLYGVIKGFGYENEFFSGISEFLGSLSIERISTLTYLTAFIVLIIGLSEGYANILHVGSTSLVDIIPAFILGSANLFLVAVIVAITGKIIDDYGRKEYLKIRRDIILLAFGVFVWMFTMSGSQFMIDPANIGNLVKSTTMGIVLVILVIEFTKYLFANEIKKREDISSSLVNKKVYTTTGKHLGKVSKVLVKGGDISALKIGRKKISKEKIVSMSKVVIVSDE